RAGVAGREARVGDHAEGRRASDRLGVRLSEVRVVEDGEELGPELKANGFKNSRVFENREIGVGEARAGDCVAAQTSEVVDRTQAVWRGHQGRLDRQYENSARRAVSAGAWIAYRVGEPLIDVANHLNGANHVWADRRICGESGDGRRKDSG